MKLKERILDIFGKFTEIFGNIAGYFFFILIFLVTTSVFLRYLFSIGFIWLQDLYIWLHAIIILLGISFTLKEDGHVRIDLVYRNLSKKRKALVNKIGAFLFGIPFSYFVFSKGFLYFQRSYKLNESSKETGGLPAIYVLKFFICFLGLMLFIELIRSILKKKNNKWK